MKRFTIFLIASLFLTIIYACSSSNYEFADNEDRSVGIGFHVFLIGFDGWGSFCCPM